MARKAELTSVAVALVTVAAVTVYGLRNGTYDVVARGEAGVLIWIVLALGWLSGVLPRARPARALWPVVAGFGALALWSAVCLSWTASDERTVVEIGRIAHHAGVVLLAASVLTRPTVPAAVAGLAFGAALLGWLGLCNWLWPGSIESDVVRTVFGANRLSYPLDYWNAMAAIGAIGIVGCLAVAAHAGSSVVRLLAALPVPGLVLMIYLTYSRGGAFELAIGLVVLLAFARHRWPLVLTSLPLAAASVLAILAVRDREALADGVGSAGAGGVLLTLVLGGALGGVVAVALHRARADERLRLPERAGTRVLVGVAALCVVAGAIAAPTVFDEAKDSFNRPGVFNPDDPTARFANLGGARAAQFENAIESWKDHPVEGTGPGTYEFTWGMSPDYGTFVRDVHSIYLEALAESGVPGLISLLVVLGSAAVIIVLAAVRARDPAARGAAAAGAAMFAVFLFAAGVDWMWELTAFTAVVLAAIGALAAGLGAEDHAPTSRSRSLGRRIAMPLVALVAILVILPPVVSTSEIRKSKAAARSGDVQAALNHAQDAIDSAPWSASAMVQRSLLLEDAGRYDAAEGFAVLAVRREPTNWRHALLRSRLLALRGDPDGAIEWYRRARALAPNNPALP